MYTVAVRSHFLVAHSLRGALFGPAQRLHGATYVVDLELRAEDLGPEGVVVDIGRANEVLAAILAELGYRNLDELPELAGFNTTTEVLARLIHHRAAERIAAGDFGPGGERVRALRVTLRESPVAWAAYEAPLPGAGEAPSMAPG
jgi:6-pyruvoyl-tetrahydropterin synthase